MTDDLKETWPFRWLTVVDRWPAVYRMPEKFGGALVCNPAHVDKLRALGLAIEADPLCAHSMERRRWFWERSGKP